MEEKNTDRRVRKTKKQLSHGLTDLMQTKSIKDITVKELADYVDINRGTFYLHYRDVFDMLEKLEDELLSEVIATFRKFDPKELSQSPRPIYSELFKIVKENAELVSVLLSPNGDIAFLNKLKNAIYDECLSHWSRLNAITSSTQQLYFASFILSGYIGLLELWLKNGMTESTEELADMGETFILNGAHSILDI